MYNSKFNVRYEHYETSFRTVILVVTLSSMTE